MKRFFAFGLLASGLALTVGTSVHASTIASETHTITANGAGSVGYTNFSITTGGLYSMYTMGPTIDPQIYLFEDLNGNGNLDEEFDVYLNTDDDSCPDSLCGSAGSYYNSLIVQTLGIGSYILAVSDYDFSLEEAYVGENVNDFTGDVTVIVESGTLAPVPLPAGLPLLVAGLGGLAALRRAQRKTQRDL